MRLLSAIPVDVTMARRDPRLAIDAGGGSHLVYVSSNGRMTGGRVAGVGLPWRLWGSGRALLGSLTPATLMLGAGALQPLARREGTGREVGL